jgi:prephenate dehydrogenase
LAQQGSDVSAVRTLALIGCGRFGAALAGLAAASGIDVRAFDLESGHDDVVRVPVLADALRDADVVMFAVPLDALGAALRDARPHLHAAQLVLDVCSVKVEPEHLLARELGDDVLWCATHPLFGPASLQDAQAARQVVVCPRPTHTTAATRARAFYEQLGCSVAELAADAHDALMARTQALAFFVGGGLRDAGFGAPQTLGPPSSLALAQLAGSVTQLAQQTRVQILGRNPHAAQARRALLTSLTRQHVALDASGAPSTSPSDPVAALDAARQHIDDLDHALLEILAARAQVARTISQAKSQLGRPVRDPPREAAALAVRVAWAQELGIDVSFTEALFDVVMMWSRAVQEQERKG